MSASQIPAAKAALLSIWQGAAALDGVSITIASPHTPAPEQIAIGGAKTERDFASLGNQTARPHYEDLEITCEAGVIGATFTGAEERLWEILDAAETVLRADWKLGGAVMFARVAKVEQSFIRTDDQPVAEAVFTVEARARI